MREWSVGAQHALLSHLAGRLAQRETGRYEELWRVQKGERTLRCLAHYLPTGIDLRLFEDDDFRRTQLCRDGRQLRGLADEWRTAQRDRGWTDVA